MNDTATPPNKILRNVGIAVMILAIFAAAIIIFVVANKEIDAMFRDPGDDSPVTTGSHTVKYEKLVTGNERAETELSLICVDGSAFLQAQSYRRGGAVALTRAVELDASCAAAPAPTANAAG